MPKLTTHGQVSYNASYEQNNCIFLETWILEVEVAMQKPTACSTCFTFPSPWGSNAVRNELPLSLTLYALYFFAYTFF